MSKHWVVGCTPIACALVIAGISGVIGFVVRDHWPQKAEQDVPGWERRLKDAFKTEKSLSFQEFQDLLNKKGFNVGRVISRKTDRMWYGPGLPGNNEVFVLDELGPYDQPEFFTVEVRPTAADASQSVKAFIDVSQRPALAWRTFFIQGQQGTLDKLKTALGD